MREKMKEEKEDRKDQVQAGSDEKKGLTRRKFLSTAAASGAAAAFVPRRVLGRGFTPPSDLLNIAGVGVGGMGRQNLINLASQNIVALCDVDWGYADQGFARLDSDIEKLRDRLEHPDRAPASGQPPAKFDRVKAKARLDGMIRLKTEHVPKAKRYKDYREMLDRSEEHTSELQSHLNLVCRLLLEKKKLRNQNKCAYASWHARHSCSQPRAMGR